MKTEGKGRGRRRGLCNNLMMWCCIMKGRGRRERGVWSGGGEGVCETMLVQGERGQGGKEEVE